MKKSKYIITNWSEYNKSLRNRGRIDFWLSEDAISSWCGMDKFNYYSDTAIEACLTLMSIYHLTLRSVQGFLDSIFDLSGIILEVPDSSTICRRRKKLKCKLISFNNSNEKIHVAVDSTGIKIYGEGEWKVRMHKESKRRTWRKLHIGVNESNGDIVAAKVTTASIADCDMLGEVISDIDNIKQVSADGY